MYSTYLNKIYEHSLREYPECTKLLHHYQTTSISEMSEDRIYQEICWIVYSSGFKNEIIQKYWPKITEAYFNFEIKKIIEEYPDLESGATIICKKSNFKNLNKAKWCLYNANRVSHMNENLNDSGLKAVLKTITKMDVLEIYEILPDLRRQLGLKGIGPVTIFHLLKNVGVDIFKPDIHVSRILDHIGFFKEIKSYREVYCILKQISDEMQIEVSSLDTALFVYGKNNENLKSLDYLV